MRRKRIICWLLAGLISLNSSTTIRAEDYEGIEYDEEGHILSPDELNADLPESTYYEDMMELESEDELQLFSAEENIEYHSEDEEPIDITNSVTIESSIIDNDEIPDFSEDNDESIFYFYEEEDQSNSDEDINTYKADFSNLRYWGTITSDKKKVHITLHVLEKALTSASFTLVFRDKNDKFLERNKITKGRLSVGKHNITCDIPVHDTVEEHVKIAIVGWNGVVAYESSTLHYRYYCEGGAYGRLKAFGGHRHHMPSKYAIAPMSQYMGPAARILIEDHRRTSSYGGGTYCKDQRDLVRQGKFLQAQEMDFEELLSMNKFYSKAIQEVRDYTRTLGYTGVVRIGWQTIDGKWYYYDASQVKQTSCWKKISDVWYYLGPTGVMQIGWVKSGSKWYYMNKDGAMQTGWVKVDNKWYYMDKSSGAMQTGWIQVNNAKYYMSSSGAMQTGWVKVDNKGYYMNPSGAMRTGWLKLNDVWYYLKSSGVMACNESMVISGKKYNFNSNGRCLNP